MAWTDHLDPARKAKLGLLERQLVTIQLTERPEGRFLVGYRGQTVLAESEPFKSVDDVELVRLAFDSLSRRLGF